MHILVKPIILLYYIFLWQESWYWIERSEHQKFQNMNDMLYNKLNKKLDSLRHTQIQVNKQHGRRGI
jgi:hypothetical protein